MKLPQEYLEYIQAGNPTFGFTDLELGGYFELEPLGTLEEMNRDVEIGKYAPEFLAFASDGGGELLAFDSDGKVYSIPLIGMESKAAVLISNSWSEYVSHIQDDA